MRIRLLSLDIAFCRPVLGLVLTLLALAVACFSATATPPATATRAPTVAPATVPLPTTTPSPLLANESPSALDLVTNEVLGVLEDILEELGLRESATDEETAASQYLKSAFQELGYDPEI